MGRRGRGEVGREEEKRGGMNGAAEGRVCVEIVKRKSARGTRKEGLKKVGKKERREGDERT